MYLKGLSLETLAVSCPLEQIHYFLSPLETLFSGIYIYMCIYSISCSEHQQQAGTSPFSTRAELGSSVTIQVKTPAMIFSKNVYSALTCSGSALLDSSRPHLELTLLQPDLDKELCEAKKQHVGGVL